MNIALTRSSIYPYLLPIAVSADQIHRALVDICLEAIHRARNYDSNIHSDQFSEHLLNNITKSYELTSTEIKAISELSNVIIEEKDDRLVANRLSMLQKHLKEHESIVALSLVGIAIDAVRRRSESRVDVTAPVPLLHSVVTADLTGAGFGLAHGGWPF